MAKREPWNPLLCSYPYSERINTLSIGAETLYTRLIAQSDDAGNYWGSPELVLAYLFGHRLAKGEVAAQDIAGWIVELERVGLAERYQSGNATYLHLVGVKKHLRGDIKPKIEHPGFTQALISQENPENVTDTVRKRNGYGTNSYRARNEFGSTESTTESTTESATESAPAAQACPHERIRSEWNALAAETGLSQVQTMTGSRKAKLRTRWAEEAFRDGWPAILEKIRGSPFLLGDTDWKVTFDWIVKNDKNFVKVLEGNYDRRRKAQTDSRPGGEAGGGDEGSPDAHCGTPEPF